jgi:uncharacterized protein (TIGR03067 family)
MKSAQVFVLFLGVLVADDAHGGDRAGKERKRLQGTWVVLSADMHGKPGPSMSGVRLRFAGQELTLERKGEKFDPIVFRIDPTTSPKHIDFEERQPPTEGIYELKGDCLRLCYAIERPGDFKPGEGAILLVLKRESPQR